MSLMERVARAGNAAVLDRPIEESMRVEELRRRVAVELPPDKLARMMQANPVRAQNEVRSAALRAMRADPWFSQGMDGGEGVMVSLLDGIFGLGALEPLLADASVTEVMVNADDAVFVERSGRLESTGIHLGGDEEVRALIDRILGPIGRRIDESTPMVDARLASGHRVNAVIPPISMDGPVVTIRKFRETVFSLEQMQREGSFDASMAGFLRLCVASRLNLAVSGGTGSGKTTLLNALSCLIEPEERIITIEDSAELRFSQHPHVVRLESRLRNAEGTGEVTIRDLVRNALRMRPDRIIVGEVRDAAALDMLQAMNTGHDGSMTTLHANSPADAVMRLVTMVRFGADLPIDVIEAQIASAVDVVVQLSRSRSGRRFICEVDELDFDRERRGCVVRRLFWRPSCEEAGEWVCPARCFDASLASGQVADEEVEAWRGLVYKD